MSIITKIVLIYTMILGLNYVFITPPFQKPDEDRHYLRALMVSNGAFECSKKPTTLVKTNQDVATFYHDYGIYKNIIQHNLRKYNPISMVKSAGRIKSNENREADIPYQTKYCMLYFVPAYVPAALGLKIASLFSLNAHTSFYAGRLMSLITYLSWFIFIIIKAKGRTKNILLIVFSLPMTLHQLSGITHDGFLIMVGLSIFFLLINNPKQFYGIAFLLALLIATKKGGYEPLLLLPLLIPQNYIARDKKNYYIKIGVFLLLSFSIILRQKISMTSILTDPDFNISAVTNTKEQLRFIQSHVGDTITVVIHTGMISFPEYLLGLIGKYGHHYYNLDPITYIGYFTAILYVALMPGKLAPYTFTSRKKILILAMIICSYFYILTLSFIVETPVGATKIIGTQGRFFIILLPYAFLLATPSKRFQSVVSTLGKKTHHFLTNILVTYLMMNALILIVGATYVAYYVK